MVKPTSHCCHLFIVLTASPGSTVPFDLVGFLRRTRPELNQDQNQDQDQDEDEDEVENAEADASHGQLAYCKFNDILQGKSLS